MGNSFVIHSKGLHNNCAICFVYRILLCLPQMYSDSVIQSCCEGFYDTILDQLQLQTATIMRLCGVHSLCRVGVRAGTFLPSSLLISRLVFRNQQIGNLRRYCSFLMKSVINAFMKAHL
jgi:hypothetical protein